MNKSISIKTILSIVVSIFLLIFAVFMIIKMINNSKNENNSNTTTITTKDSTKIEYFNSSLKDIIGKNKIEGDFDTSFYYNGLDFNFKCSDYDSNSLKCIAGGGFVKLNNEVIPIFNFTSQTDNAINYPEDIYIIYNKNYLIIVDNHVGVRIGTMTLYDSNGSYLTNIKNVLTGYRINDNLFKKLYPNFDDNKLYYYSCDSNIVKIKYIELNNLNNEIIDSVVDNASCT